MSPMQHQLIHAKIIHRNFGIARAAKYMATRGWTLEGALWVLLKTAVREKT
jgi:hypothetical protein